MFNFLHTFNPQPIFFQLGFLKIHWYGVFIACGVVIGFISALALAKRYNIAKEKIYDLAFYLLIFGLIGDRLYYVFYAWEYYGKNLLDIFKIWQGGLAIHGAMISGVIVIYIFGKKTKINPWLLADIVVVSLAIAMAIGRFGNYFNQELFGRPTDLPWGIPIAADKRPAEFAGSTYFHPTFLYESLWNLLTFGFLLLLHKLRIKKNKNNQGQIPGLGNITLVYLILYSVGRILTEFLRLDYTPYFLGLRWAQFFSLLAIALCLIILGVKLIRKIKSRA